MTPHARLPASLPKDARIEFCHRVTIVAVEAPSAATSRAVGVVGSNSIGGNATEPKGHEVDRSADPDHHRAQACEHQSRIRRRAMSRCTAWQHAGCSMSQPHVSKTYRCGRHVYIAGACLQHVWPIRSMDVCRERFSTSARWPCWSTCTQGYGVSTSPPCPGVAKKQLGRENTSAARRRWPSTVYC